MSVDRSSRLLLRILIICISLMFLAFHTIGYNRLFDEDTRFREPLLTDVLIVFVAIILMGCMIVSLWSVFVVWRRKRHDVQVNAIPKRKVWTGLGVMVGVGGLIGWCLGPVTLMKVNGQLYDDAFGLKTANMFVSLCLAMTMLTLLVLVFSSWKSMRQHRL